MAVRQITRNNRIYFTNFFRFAIYFRVADGVAIENPPCCWSPYFLSDDYQEILTWERGLVEQHPDYEVAIIASDPEHGFCPGSKIRWHHNRQVTGRISSGLAGLINSVESDWF